MNNVPTKNSLRIDPVTQSDLEPVARLAREIWYLHYPGIITVGQIDYMLDQRYHPEVIGTQIASREAWWDKIEYGSFLAGFACYEPGTEPASIKLDKLYVHPRTQGLGLGSALIRHVQERSLDRGFSKIYLQVNKGNAASIAFYRKSGFDVTERVTVDIGNGYVMDDFVMSRNIEGQRS